MTSKNCSITINKEVIPEILQLIEKHGISAFEAEQIPTQLERAIKLQNLLQMEEIGFKFMESQAK